MSEELDRRLRERFADLPLKKCPPELTARIEAAVAAEAARPRRARTVAKTGWLRWAMPLAAAAALAAVLLVARPQPAPRYTEAELSLAREQTFESLSVVVTVIEQTQREAVGEVLGRQLPATLRSSVQRALRRSEGGHG